MNYMLKKSKTRGAQPESPAPKKEHYSMLNATRMKTKKRKLDTLKKLSKLQHPGNNPVNLNILVKSLQLGKNII